MPPKFKFTREQIVAAALEVTRKNGITGLTARGLAAELGSSAKPIFGLFARCQLTVSGVMKSFRRNSNYAENQRMASAAYRTVYLLCEKLNRKRKCFRLYRIA